MSDTPPASPAPHAPCLDDFPFERVREVMRVLDMKLDFGDAAGEGLPSVDRLRKLAEELIRDAETRLKPNRGAVLHGCGLSARIVQQPDQSPMVHLAFHVTLMEPVKRLLDPGQGDPAQ